MSAPETALQKRFDKAELCCEENGRGAKSPARRGCGAQSGKAHGERERGKRGKNRGEGECDACGNKGRLQIVAQGAIGNRGYRYGVIAGVT